jgi:hypothetical protein
MTSQIANEKLYLKRGRRSGIMKELAGQLKIMEKHKSKRENQRIPWLLKVVRGRQRHNDNLSQTTWQLIDNSRGKIIP